MTGTGGDETLEDQTTIPTAAVDSFSVLANETRLSILLTLWEAQYGAKGPDSLAFSELRERVGMRDSGQFNYHLETLTDRFIKKTEVGYGLTYGGARFIRTILAWEPADSPTIEPTKLDRHCPFCGAPIEISYSEEFVAVDCTQCKGFGSAIDGALQKGPLPPAGVVGRTPDEVLLIAVIYHLHLTDPMLKGVCPECTAPVERRLRCCSDHDASDGSCTACGSRFLGTIPMHCQNCYAPNLAPVWNLVMQHPAVISFFYDRDIELWKDPWEGLFTNGANAEEVPVNDGEGIRLTFAAAGDNISVDVQEDLTMAVTDLS